KIYTKAMTTFLEADTLAAVHGLGNQYEIDKHLAYAAQNAGLDELAWKHYRSSATVARKQAKWTDLLWIMQQEASLAHSMKQYARAYAIDSAIYHLADSIHNEGYRTTAMNNLGHAAKYAGRNAEAMRFFSEALRAAQRTQDARLQGQLLQSMGILSQIQHDYKAAIDHLLKAAAKYKAASAYREEANVMDYLALVHYQNNQTYEAMVMSNQAIDLAQRRGYHDVLQSSYNTRATIYESLHEYESALADYKRHLRLEDSLMEIERRKKDNILQQQFILERMEKELKLFYINEEIKESENAKLRAERQAAEEKNKSLAKDAENQQLIANKAKTELELVRRQRRLEQQNSQISNLNLERERQKLLLDYETLRADSVRQANAQLETEKANQQLELDNEKLKLSEETLKLSQEKARNRNLFLFLGGLGLVLLVIVAILLQLRSKNRRIANQNLVILENQRMIEAEKEKTDALLLNILPATVAAELKATGTSTPKHYDAVTVLFTDFVGFTKISERMRPAELISTLDKVFLEFDLICERHGLSRIKTIGDSYMCVAGLPAQDKAHAAHAVAAALEMVDFVGSFNAAIPDPSMRWHVRVGLNSGPVVAGVVGIKKFAYDIWGDTVNTASRMESSGEPGKVNVSGSTHALIKSQFECVYRGKVSAKNKGEVDMYFVTTP
ncbi:MAG TPA: adenylate/guanylate cyclase domain-containing protein, partial [Bacteroidia bacterium]|nr:adenylate/guanylate cyclase domain-containing protein [Bacteroidia bacterium]